MKKLLTFLIVALSLACVLSSCDLWYGIFGDPIVGTWAMTAETIDGNVLTVGTGPGQVSMTMIVAKGGTITGSGTMNVNPLTITGTWTRSNTTYTLVVTDVGGGTSTTTGTLSSDGRTMNGTIAGGAGSNFTAGTVTMARQ